MRRELIRKRLGRGPMRWIPPHILFEAFELVLADVRDLSLGEPDEVGGRKADGFVVRAGLDDDRLPFGEPGVNEDTVAAPTAQRRHGAKIKLGIVAREIVFRREVNTLLADAEKLADLARVEPLRRGQ